MGKTQVPPSVVVIVLAVVLAVIGFLMWRGTTRFPQKPPANMMPGAKAAPAGGHTQKAAPGSAHH